MHELATAFATHAGTGPGARLVRAVDIVGFGARSDTDALVIDRNGVVAGAILGAAASREIARTITRLHADHGPGVRSYAFAVHGADAAELGLTCGGELRLVVEDVEHLPPVFVADLVQRRSVIYATRIDGRGDGTLVIDSDGASTSTLGDPLLDEAVERAAAELAARGRSARRIERTAGAEILVEVCAPRPRLVVVGVGDLAHALAAQSALLGWECEIVDGADAAVSAIFPLATTDGVVVLSHDAAVDVPALLAATRGAVGYVGALGSRATQAARSARLVVAGLDEEHRKRIHGPAGLDLGASGVAESAVSIVAEMLCVRAGRSGASLRSHRGPIHATR